MPFYESRAPAARRFFSAFQRWGTQPDLPVHNPIPMLFRGDLQPSRRTRFLSWKATRTLSTSTPTPPVSPSDQQVPRYLQPTPSEDYLSDPVRFAMPREEHASALRESVDAQQRSDAFIRAMSYLTNPVAFISAISKPTEENTTQSGARKPFSNARIMTISSLSSVAASPVPYISFNIRLPSQTFDALQPMFRVSLLKRTREAMNTAIQCTLGDTAESLLNFKYFGLPELKGDHITMPHFSHICADYFICKVYKTIEVGDHVVVVAEVLDVHLSEGGMDRLHYGKRIYQLDPKQLTQNREKTDPQVVLHSFLMSRVMHYLRGPKGRETLQANGIWGVIQASKVHKWKYFDCYVPLKIRHLIKGLKKACPELLYNLSDEQLMRGHHSAPPSELPQFFFNWTVQSGLKKNADKQAVSTENNLPSSKRVAASLEHNTPSTPNIVRQVPSSKMVAASSEHNTPPTPDIFRQGDQESRERFEKFERELGELYRKPDKGHQEDSH